MAYCKKLLTIDQTVKIKKNIRL